MQTSIDEQAQIFEAQLQLGQELQRPISVSRALLHTPSYSCKTDCKPHHNAQEQFSFASLHLDVACNNIRLDVVQVHCVSAFGRLQEILQQHAPFPNGLILHSWIGPAELVDALAKLQGVYFSLSGHLTRMSKRSMSP